MSKQKNKKIRIDVEDMRRAVNKHDKAFGVKLKKINPQMEPEILFKDYVGYLEEFLVSVIYELNGIPKEKRNGDFSSLSILGWRSGEKYEPKSIMFRYRFMTLFLLDYIKKLDKIAIRKYDYLSKFKTGKYENGYFYLKNLAKDTRRFVSIMSSGNSYSNIITQMNQNCTFMYKNDDPVKVNKYIREIKHELKNGLQCSLFAEPMMPEDIAIDSILKLAYLLSTGDSDIKSAIPNFRYIEGASTEYELRGLIEELGNSILDAHMERKCPIMYMAFLKSMPYLTSKYNDVNEDWYISTGVKALEYTKFFCNDKYITKFINKMLKNQNVK